MPCLHAEGLQDALTRCHTSTRDFKSGEMSRSTVLGRFNTKAEVDASSDHGSHDFADAALELFVVGDRAAYCDFAGKVRMNAAADQLRGVN